ncbi:MAG: adenylate kinase [Actinomycetota bacterium]|nr:adenylate kinase [Actinomycetota bacterium]
MSELNLILLGPPGAGKGTQADLLRTEFELPYYATGDILRAAVKEESDLGRLAREYMDRGDLVPDELIGKVVVDRIDSDEARDGFVLDGFPRTVGQAEQLSQALDGLGRHLTATLLIDAPDEEVIRRLSGRRVCRDSGHTYHVDFDPPEKDGFCDQDGSPLIQRDDDSLETVRHRLKVFHDQTKPLVDLYENEGLLRRFDGTGSPEEVNGHIRATLATLRLEEQL